MTIHTSIVQRACNVLVSHPECPPMEGTEGLACAMEAALEAVREDLSDDLAPDVAPDLRCYHCRRWYAPDEGEDELFCSEECRRAEQEEYEHGGVTP